MMNSLNKILLRRFFIFDHPQEKLSETQHQSLCEFERKVQQGTYKFENVSCLCGDPGGILMTERDRYCLPVKTYLCTSCGTLRTSPRLDEPSLSTFYEQDYRSIYVGNPQAPDEFFEQQENTLPIHWDYKLAIKNIYIYILSSLESELDSNQ